MAAPARPPEASDEERRAWAGLLRLCEPPSPAVAGFVESVGAVPAWAAIMRRRAPAAVLQATAARSAELPGPVDRMVEADLARAAAVGARVIGPGHPDWPADAFAGFAAATIRGVRGAATPLALYVRGRLPAILPDRAVAVVGSRACSPYGQRVAGELAHAVASAGVTVVSGAAFGIDSAAHRAALRGGVTAAVLACGIDRAYPQANHALIESIAASGSVISEYPPGSTPARHRFLVRNRLLAALCAGTVVVEAGRRSGTLSTAAAAEALGRLVMAVPGPVTSATSVGCHLLLAARYAELVTGPVDVLRALGWQEPVPGLPALGADPRHPTDGLDADTARVYEALPGRGVRLVGELVAESGLLAPIVLAALGVLEVSGLAERDGAHWRRIRPATGPGR